MAEQTGRRIRTDREAETAPSDFATVVGERIRKARQHRGWTQVELAEASGLSGNYIARLERGELGPSLFVASHIAEALGTTIDKLVAASTTRSASTTQRSGKRRIA
jgi:transcriptional regulator with XRE-family HTH domain